MKLKDKLANEYTIESDSNSFELTNAYLIGFNKAIELASKKFKDDASLMIMANTITMAHDGRAIVKHTALELIGTLLGTAKVITTIGEEEV